MCRTQVHIFRKGALLTVPKNYLTFMAAVLAPVWLRGLYLLHSPLSFFSLLWHSCWSLPAMPLTSRLFLECGCPSSICLGAPRHPSNRLKLRCHASKSTSASSESMPCCAELLLNLHGWTLCGTIASLPKLCMYWSVSSASKVPYEASSKVSEPCMLREWMNFRIWWGTVSIHLTNLPSTHAPRVRS